MPGRSWARRAACALAVLASCAFAQERAGDSPQEIFERAMEQRARGDLHEAIRSFQTLLNENPALNRARVELAVAYYHALDHRAALEQARLVLADPATPPSVRANLERLIAQIEADAAPHRFGGNFNLGLLYDTNASAGPSGPNYEVGGGVVAIDPNAVQRSDTGLITTLGGSHRWLSPLRPGIGGRDGALLWQSQALFNRVTYRNVSSYDLQAITVSTGPAWISPPRLRAAAPVQVDRLDLGNAHYLDIVGSGPSVVFGGLAGTELQLDALLQKRTYRRNVDQGRDSHYRSVGGQAGRVFAELTVQGGLRFNRDNADAARWDYHGHEWFALLAGTFAGRGSAYARYTRLYYDYDAPDPVAATGRTDRERRWSLGAAWRVAGTVQQPWSLSVNLLDISHGSTIPFDAFDRQQWSLTLSGAF
jgi:hypothetical protein